MDEEDIILTIKFFRIHLRIIQKLKNLVCKWLTGLKASNVFTIAN